MDDWDHVLQVVHLLDLCGRGTEASMGCAGHALWLCGALLAMVPGYLIISVVATVKWRIGPKQIIFAAS